MWVCAWKYLIYAWGSVNGSVWACTCMQISLLVPCMGEHMCVRLVSLCARRGTWMHTYAHVSRRVWGVFMSAGVLEACECLQWVCMGFYALASMIVFEGQKLLSWDISINQSNKMPNWSPCFPSCNPFSTLQPVWAFKIANQITSLLGWKPSEGYWNKSRLLIMAWRICPPSQSLIFVASSSATRQAGTGCLSHTGKSLCSCPSLLWLPWLLGTLLPPDFSLTLSMGPSLTTSLQGPSVPSLRLLFSPLLGQLGLK